MGFAQANPPPARVEGSTGIPVENMRRGAPRRRHLDAAAVVTCVPHVIWPARIQMEATADIRGRVSARDILTSDAEKVVGPDRQTADRSRRLRREQRAVHADVAPHEEIVARERQDERASGGVE